VLLAEVAEHAVIRLGSIPKAGTVSGFRLGSRRCAGNPQLAGKRSSCTAGCAQSVETRCRQMNRWPYVLCARCSLPAGGAGVAASRRDRSLDRRDLAVGRGHGPTHRFSDALMLAHAPPVAGGRRPAVAGTASRGREQSQDRPRLWLYCAGRGVGPRAVRPPWRLGKDGSPQTVARRATVCFECTIDAGCVSVMCGGGVIGPSSLGAPAVAASGPVTLRGALCGRCTGTG
jgi:hypothetical protein